MPITKIIDNGSLLEIHDQDFRGLLITELEKSTGIILKKDTQYLYITYPTTLTTQTIDPSQVVDPVNTGVDDLFNIIDGYLQTGAAGDLNGFIDYNDTTGAFSITADTWTDLPNDGQGAFSNDSYKPTGVTELIDTTTGYIDPSELNLGDTILVRNDYTINPNTNNALLKFRYELGNGGGTYTLEKIIGRLDSGSGQNYRFSLTPDLIYMGDTNTRDNPIKLQVYCTSNATVTNAGSVIQVIKR